MTRRLAGQAAALLLLWAILLPLVRLPLTSDEGRALWAVRDERPLSLDAPLDALRALRRNLDDTLNRLSDQAQPLPGVLLLDAWTTLAGESVLAARLPGMLAVLLAASLVGGGPLALLAAGLLALIPAAQAGSHCWLLLASALTVRATRAKSPGWLLGAALLLAMTTHRAGPLLIPVALLLVDRSHLRRWLPWTLGAMVLALPWLLPGGFRPLAGSAGEWLAGVTALLVPPAAWGLSRLAARDARHGGMTAAVVAVMAIASVGVISARTDWRAALDSFAGQRAPSAPVIKLYAPQHPLAHYERQPDTDALRQGTSLDLGWREFSAEEAAAVAEVLAGAPEIWLVAPADVPLATAVRIGLQGRDFDTDHVITAGDMRFWRLDASR
ncbi:MAG: hypothetical protein ACOCZH_01495 [Phototrophicaceae bacterium]